MGGDELFQARVLTHKREHRWADSKAHILSQAANRGRVVPILIKVEAAKGAAGSRQGKEKLAKPPLSANN